MMPRKLPSMENHQRGAVLFIALIFLLLLTMLGITASGTSILQERMTGSVRNRQLGLMGAESGLRAGEAKIWNLAYNAAAAAPLPPCIETSGGDCRYMLTKGRINATAQTFRTSRTWLDAGSDGALAHPSGLDALSGGDKTATLASKPRFLVEDLGPDVPPGAGRRGGSNQQERNGVDAGSHEFFRITARSQGGSDAVLRVAESVFSATAPNTHN
jgi:type IV pilus assembly protein PilX